MKLKVTEDKQFLKIVECVEDLHLQQLRISLTKYAHNYFFKRKNSKYSGWDGKVTFIDKNLRIPIGLWYNVQEICEEFDIPCEMEGIETVIDLGFDEADFNSWVSDYFSNLDMKPRDYQIDACIKILKWRRSISEIATSAGKTLIMFMVFAYLKHKGILNKMLVIVPTIQLVAQTIEKFEEYSKDKTLISFKSQMIMGGEDKSKKDVDLIIGTYQSLCKMDSDWYGGVNVVCGDEAHTASAKSVISIIKMCNDANIRFGMSGTTKIKNNTSEAFTVLGLFGPQINKISANFLFKNKYASPVCIKMLYLNYVDDVVKNALMQIKTKKQVDPRKLYGYERDILINSEIRLDFILEFVSKLKTNTLILFQDIKRGYGKKIYNKLKDILDKDVIVFYVDGNTDKKLREYYRKEMNKEDKLRIMVASYGCFSTGIDINNLHNIILAESYKSEVIIRQSIGRGMRLQESKSRVNIIDIIDDYSTVGYKNYLMKHALEREHIYKQEKFKIKKYKISLK